MIQASKPISDQHSLTVVDLMLDNLGRPAGEGFEAGLKPLVLIMHLDGLPAFGFPGSGEGETALLRLIRPGFPDNLRVEQDHVFALIVKYDDPLVDADHVGRHACTAVPVGGQGVQQVLGDGQIVRRGGLCFLGEEGLVFHNGLDHGGASVTAPCAERDVFVDRIA